MNNIAMLPYFLVLASAFIAVLGGLLGSASLLTIIKRLLALAVWFYFVGLFLARFLSEDKCTAEIEGTKKGTRIDVKIGEQEGSEKELSDEDGFVELKPPKIDNGEDGRGRIRGGR